MTPYAASMRLFMAIAFSKGYVRALAELGRRATIQLSDSQLSRDRAWRWPRRPGRTLIALPTRFWSILVRVHRRLIGAATFETFERIGGRTDAAAFLERLLERFSRGRGSAVALAACVGLAARCGRRTEARRLAEWLVARYRDDIGAQQQAGVRAFLAGDYECAEYVWDACNKRREALVAQRGLDRLNLRFLGPSWVIAIGHIAHLDIYFKWRELKQREETVILNPPLGFAIPNQDLLGRWRGRLLFAVPEGLRLRPADVELLQDEFWSLPAEGGRWRMYSHAGSWVQGEWERQGRRPLLALSEEDHRRARPLLDALGVPRGAWFVCLHVREPGFHKQWHQLHPATRNADVATYLDAVRAVVERGGYVVRMGDRSMMPLTGVPGLLDYAHSPVKSDFMDVYLCGACRFFIGTNSGLALVPPVFGVPCVLTNWSPIGLPNWYPQDLFIPKLCYSERLGRMLGFDEMLLTRAGWEQFSDYFEGEGIQVLDNSPEDLREAVIEMLDRSEGRLELSDEDERSLNEFDAIALQAGSYRGSRVASRFLRKYRRLLPSANGRNASIPTGRASG